MTRSVHAGTRHFSLVSKSLLNKSYLYVGMKLVGPSLKPWKTCSTTQPNSTTTKRLEEIRKKDNTKCQITPKLIWTFWTNTNLPYKRIDVSTYSLGIRNLLSVFSSLFDQQLSSFLIEVNMTRFVTFRVRNMDLAKVLISSLIETLTQSLVSILIQHWTRYQSVLSLGVELVVCLQTRKVLL